jgi:hypothetical protein
MDVEKLNNYVNDTPETNIFVTFNLKNVEKKTKVTMLHTRID